MTPRQPSAFVDPDALAFDELVQAFLAAEKVAVRGMRWRSDRVDHARASFKVISKLDRRFFGRVELGSRLSREPLKYSFSVIFRNERVLGLDVEPGISHINLVTLASVLGTHWQVWPSMDAMIDNRTLGYSRWLDVFLKRADIYYPFKRRPPPFREAQGRLPV